MRVKVEKTV